MKLRRKRPPFFMATGIHLVLFLIETALDALLEQLASTLWNLANVSEKVKSSRRREDLPWSHHARGRDARRLKSLAGERHDHAGVILVCAFNAEFG